MQLVTAAMAEPHGIRDGFLIGNYYPCCASSIVYLYNKFCGPDTVGDDRQRTSGGRAESPIRLIQPAYWWVYSLIGYQ